MSFQAYIDNIKTKTGKTPEDFKLLAQEKGFITGGEVTVKAGKKTLAWVMDMLWLFMQHSKEKQNKTT